MSKSTTTNKTLPMLINGSVVYESNTFPVYNPATEEIVALAPECSKENLGWAVESAANAFEDWSQPENEQSRREAMRAAADAIDENVESVAQMFTAEQGKPIANARGETKGCANQLRSYADRDLRIGYKPNNTERRIELRRAPIGVVACITPWNFPLGTAMGKIVPALLVGNTVVAKPSPHTPLALLRIAEIIKDALPPGTLNVISGDDQLGRDLVAHPGVGKISFTGSVPAGKSIAEVAGKDLKKVTLELGGNDAAIICKDADPTQTAKNIARAVFFNTGQVCIAVKRIYIHEEIFEPFVNELSVQASSYIVGDGANDDTQLGPLCTEAQFKRVCELAEDAVKNGAKVHCGGKPLDRKGYFFPPTVLSNLNDSVRLVAEEQFGPIIPVLTFKDEEEAIERANNTEFGLSGSIWSKDVERAEKLATKLECGSVWVNEHMRPDAEAPFGGVKRSGIGRENGDWSLDSMSELKTYFL